MPLIEDWSLGPRDQTKEIAVEECKNVTRHHLTTRIIPAHVWRKKGACIRAQRQINKLEKGQVHIDSCRWSVFQHHSESLRDTQHVLVTPAAQVDENDLVFR